MPSAVAAPRVLRDDAAEAVRGIGLALVAYIIMTAGDAAGKWALLPAGVGLVMVGRGVSGAATVAVMAVGGGDWRRLLPVRWKLVAFRSLMHASVSITWYIAWTVISLADTYALGFTAPLIMTLLAIPMLGERIRWRRALSTALGFVGMLVMVRPGGDLWRPEVLILMPGIFGMALSRIMTRVLSTTETPECLTFWLMAAHVPAGVLIWMLGYGVNGALTADIWIALGLMGLFNGFAHWMMARAYALAPIAALAPYEYTMLIWGTLFGFLLFRETPHTSSIIGAAIVVAAGLYNLHRERMRRLESQSA